MTVELPAYLGALNVFRLSGVAVEGVALHSEGVDIEGLRRSSARTGATYLIPDFQNPTGTCYSKEARTAVAQTLAANGALLVDQAYPFDNATDCHATPSQPPALLTPLRDTTARITSYNVCYTKLLRG